MGEKNSDEEHSGSRDCLFEAVKNGASFGSFGLLLSAYKNATEVHSKGAMGVFTRTGSDITYFAVAGLAYSGVTCLSEKIREKDDYWNKTIGGAVAGGIAGATKRNFGAVSFGAFATGFAMFLYGYTGDSLIGIYQGQTAEERNKRRAEFFASDEEKQKRREDRQLALEYSRNYIPKANLPSSE